MPPAVSSKQQRYMAGCAMNPGKAKGKCPPASVAKEFMHLDEKKKRKKKRDDDPYS